MQTVILLFLADLQKNRLYYVTAALGVAAAVAGVVWNYGSFTTQEHQNEIYAHRLLGAYDLLVGAENPYRSPLARRPSPRQPSPRRPSPRGQAQAVAKPSGRPRSKRPAASAIDLGSTVDWLKQASGVAKVDMAFTSRVVLQHELPWTGPPLAAAMFAVDQGSFTPPTALPSDQWLPQGTEANRAVVIDRQQAERMAAELGDMITVTGPGSRIELRVCGIVNATRPFMRSGNVYLTLPTAARIMGCPQDPPDANIAMVQLAAEADKAALLGLLERKSGGLQVVDAEQIAEGFNAQAGRGAWGGDMGLYVIVLSFAVSSLVVFITLNLGISKRVRQFGMLRTIGASRSQIAGFILLESLFMGILGSAGGIALGALVLEMTTRSNPTLFPNGMALGLPVLVCGIGCGLGGALVAACLPAIQAIRQTPLAVMTSTVPRRHTRTIVAAAIVGGLLVLPALGVSLVPDLPVRTRALLFTATGLPGILVGCLLLTPAMVLLTGWALCKPLALMMRLPEDLLASETSRHLRRTVGVTLLMAASVGSFVAVSTWGSTMLKPFLPNEDCPDLAITFQPNGLPLASIDAVKKTPGFATGKCLPLYTRHIDIGAKARAAVKANEIIQADGQSILLVGLDAERAFLGDDPLFKLNLQHGNDSDVAAKLQEGGYCLIPSSFAAQSQLEVGDRLDLGAPSEPDALPIDPANQPSFVIAGIYTTPWHLLTKKGGMRGVHGASYDCQAMVLVGEGDAKPLMRNQQINSFWANYTDAFRDKPFEERIAAVRASLGKVAIACGPSRYHDPRTGQPLHVASPWFRVGDLGHVISGIHDHAGDIIASMSRLPLWSLSVAALALMNTIITSVRTRRWSLGVMRAVGMSRGQLLRLILVEALLIGLCGSLMGLVAGLYAGWTTARMAHYVFHFSGIHITLVIPWLSLAAGIALALTATVLAALLPAYWTARQLPLSLLQEGRLSM